MISEKRLREWESLAQEATEGPWYRCLFDICRLDIDACCKMESIGKTCGDYTVSSLNKKNIDFIAASREAVPALIAEVRRLQAKRDRMRQLKNKIHKLAAT